MIKIDSGVPIPQFRTTHGVPNSRCKYPIRELLVGDSFAVPVPEGKTPSQTQTVITATVNRMKIDGSKFTTRSLVEDGERVIRCWRVA